MISKFKFDRNENVTSNSFFYNIMVCCFKFLVESIQIIMDELLLDISLLSCVSLLQNRFHNQRREAKCKLIGLNIAEGNKRYFVDNKHIFISQIFYLNFLPNDNKKSLCLSKKCHWLKKYFLRCMKIWNLYFVFHEKCK